MSFDISRRRIIAAAALLPALPVLGLSAQETQVIEGQVMWRERIALPPNAQLTVSLRDVSRADAPSITVATGSGPAGPGTGARFRVALPPKGLDARKTYSLHAQISVDGQLWFTSTDHIPVTQDNRGPYEIMVTRVSSTSAPAAASPLGNWIATELQGAPVASGITVTLDLGADGMATGSGGCNRYTGSYKLDGQKLSFGQMASTMMACIGDGMAVEASYHKALEATTGFAIGGDGGALALTDAAGKVLVRLRRADS